MKKYKFTNLERLVIWENYDNKCFWCGEPLRFNDTSVDHVIPESLLENPEKLNQVKFLYKLPENFEINNFENWVPAHMKCNSRKGIKIFENSPVMIMILEQLLKKSEKLKTEYEKLKHRQSKDKVVGKLVSDLENNTISSDDLIELLKDIIPFENASPVPLLKKNEITHIPEDAKVLSVDRNNRHIRVVLGNRAGNVPMDEMPERSWMCDYCHNYGPWNGNQCIICGHFSSPFD